MGSVCGTDVVCISAAIPCSESMPPALVHGSCPWTGVLESANEQSFEQRNAASASIFTVTYLDVLTYSPPFLPGRGLLNLRRPCASTLLLLLPRLPSPATECLLRSDPASPTELNSFAKCVKLLRASGLRPFKLELVRGRPKLLCCRASDTGGWLSSGR